MRMHRCYCFPDGLEDVLSLFFLSQSGLNVIALPNINIADGMERLEYECRYDTARSASITSADAGVKYPTKRIAQRITMIFNYKELEKVANNTEGLIDKSSRELCHK